MTCLRLLPLLLLVLACELPLHAQNDRKTPKEKRTRKASIKLTTVEVATKDVVYKTTPEGELKLHFFLPKGEMGITALRPCVVFFFGGGWKGGSYLQFVPQAEYLASRGIVAACADYRVLNVHKTLPDKAVEDAKSAIRWVRAHAPEFNVDPGKIIASGGSAGGHLAACTALVAAYDAESDDKTVSARPDAMVLFNPAMNVGTLRREGTSTTAATATGFTQEMADAITPNSFVTKDTPPAILFFGTTDRLKKGGDEYVQTARSLGVRAEMWSAPGQAHGFFNREPWAQITVRQMEDFLASLGYLGGESAIKLPENAPALKAE